MKWCWTASPGSQTSAILLLGEPVGTGTDDPRLAVPDADADDPVGTDDDDDGRRLPGFRAAHQLGVSGRENVGPSPEVVGVKRKLSDPGSDGIDDWGTGHLATGDTPSAIGDDDEGVIVLEHLGSVFGTRSGGDLCHRKLETNVHRVGDNTACHLLLPWYAGGMAPAARSRHAYLWRSRVFLATIATAWMMAACGGGAAGSAAGGGGGAGFVSLGVDGAWQSMGGTKIPQTFRLDVDMSGKFPRAWLWGANGLVSDGPAGVDPSRPLTPPSVNKTPDGPFVIPSWAFGLDAAGRPASPARGFIEAFPCQDNNSTRSMFDGVVGADVTPPEIWFFDTSWPFLPWDSIDVVASEGLDPKAFSDAVAVAGAASNWQVLPDESMGAPFTSRVSLHAVDWSSLGGTTATVTVAPGLRDPAGNVSVGASRTISFFDLGPPVATVPFSGPQLHGFFAGDATECAPLKTCLVGPKWAFVAASLLTSGASKLHVRYRASGMFNGPSPGSWMEVTLAVPGATPLVSRVVLTDAQAEWTDAYYDLPGGDTVGLGLVFGQDHEHALSCASPFTAELQEVSVE